MKKQIEPLEFYGSEPLRDKVTAEMFIKTTAKINEIIEAFEEHDESGRHIKRSNFSLSPKEEECGGKDCRGCNIHRGAMNVPSPKPDIEVEGLLEEYGKWYVEDCRNTMGGTIESLEKERTKRMQEIVATLKALTEKKI